MKSIPGLEHRPRLERLRHPLEEGEKFAAIDMGSNSFHMVVAEVMNNEIRVLQKLGEKVQLGAGLDSNGFLDAASQHRAFECLRRFRQRLTGMSHRNVQIVGTNALREARNAVVFLAQAEKIVGHPIAIISGREEARLIYLGVSHSLADDAGNRLVIDIGGGSTEFVIGERFETKALESLQLGCVTYRDLYFPKGRISAESMDKAVIEGSREILGIRTRYRQLKWDHAVGASGSIKAISQALATLGLSDGRISASALQELRRRIVAIGKCSELGSLGIRKDRLSIFPSGLAILLAAFETLEIEDMDICDGALREGLLYDMLGRNRHEDVRERTIHSMQARYRVDQEQAEQVEQTALRIWQQVAFEWEVDSEEKELLLRWGCRLHEIGLFVAHSGFHKHGAYLLQYADMAGYSQQTQLILATLVRCHRRKLNPELFEAIPEDTRLAVIRLTVLLRLAVVLQHARNVKLPDDLRLEVSDPATLSLYLDPAWLREHPLSRADLEAEQNYLNRIGFKLKLNV